MHVPTVARTRLQVPYTTTSTTSGVFERTKFDTTPDDTSMLLHDRLVHNLVSASCSTVSRRQFPITTVSHDHSQSLTRVTKSYQVPFYNPPSVTCLRLINVPKSTQLTQLPLRRNAPPGSANSGTRRCPCTSSHTPAILLPYPIEFRSFLVVFSLLFLVLLCFCFSSSSLFSICSSSSYSSSSSSFSSDPSMSMGAPLACCRFPIPTFQMTSSVVESSH